MYDRDFKDLFNLKWFIGGIIMSIIGSVLLGIAFNAPIILLSDHCSYATLCMAFGASFALSGFFLMVLMGLMYNGRERR